VEKGWWIALGGSETDCVRGLVGLAADREYD
jgi:hypothetical protein